MNEAPADETTSAPLLSVEGRAARATSIDTVLKKLAERKAKCLAELAEVQREIDTIKAGNHS